MDKLDQFLAYLKHERYALPNSIISYRSDLSMMLDYFKERNIELENVDHKVIRDYLLTLHKRKLKKTSIYKKVSCIKSFFRFCKERAWIKNGLIYVLLKELLKDTGSFQGWLRRSPLEHSGTLLPLISWNEGRNPALFKGFWGIKD